MKREAKEGFVAGFRTKIEESTVMYLTDFSGLDVAAMTELRDKIRDSGAEFMVVKNRLAKRALSGLEIPDLSEFLKGPTGVVVSTADAVEPARAVTDFAKSHDERPVFKVGVLDGSLVESGEIKRIASLPPREQLLAEAAGAFQAPLSAFVGVLEALTREMAGLLEALKESKE